MTSVAPAGTSGRVSRVPSGQRISSESIFDAGLKVGILSSRRGDFISLRGDDFVQALDDTK